MSQKLKNFFKDDLKFAYNTIRSLGDPYQMLYKLNLVIIF